MTCIIGFKDKVSRRVFIGGDSAGVAGCSVTPRKDPKVFEKNGFVIGGTSSFRMLQLLYIHFDPEYDPEIYPDLYEYMVMSFIADIREIFKDHGYLKKENEVESGGQFIVGYQDRMFMIYSDFQVEESLRLYCACGSGEAWAEGAIRAFLMLAGSMDPKEIINHCLEITEEHCSWVRGPHHILHTNPKVSKSDTLTE